MIATARLDVYIAMSAVVESSIAALSPMAMMDMQRLCIPASECAKVPDKTARSSQLRVQRPNPKYHRPTLNAQTPP
jgi:hypothetical protein